MPKAEAGFRATLAGLRTSRWWQWVAAEAIFIVVMLLRIVVLVRRGDPLWSPTLILTELLLGLNVLVLCFRLRQRTKIRRLEAERDRLQRELAELERERTGPAPRSVVE